MLKFKKYAAIDIGSNAVRLLVADIIEQENKPTIFRKTSLVRVPIRLGSDVFIDHTISESNKQRMVDTMLAFKLLMKSHKVQRYKACATSAMRESTNGIEVVKAVRQKSGITIDVIDGEVEAAIIAATDLKSYLIEDKTYLYVDVGGGSTEFSVIHGGITVASKSFKVGTVRLLNDMVPNALWKELEIWIKTNTEEFEKVDLIGSGGNINKIFKLSGKKMGRPLTYFWLTSFYNDLQNYTYDERITELDLNQDRADVIIPATRIYLSSMKWSGAKDIYVPKIGLSDGIVKSMYFNTVSSQELD
ncbi:Ppx/GppA phosphatase family protein [Aegicerativicinus sediminis]|uniref:Ppx/GppA phosphatase family protein n=1 Tax=Aegicerativicinus sediminis TaxID=2893202 RepID=UPI001E43027E|nr:rod shape-determining protein [Aegicerativicinus sediminis]